MYCLKCGREVHEEQVFCPECVAVMEKYPVKPGTVVRIPKRREGASAARTAARRKLLTPEEQIRKLRRQVRNYFILWLVTFVALCAISVFAVLRVLDHEDFTLGQNYSLITSAQSENG